MIQVIHKKHAQGGKGYVYIGRPSVLGNPYVIGQHGNRAQVIALYEQWLRGKLAEEGSNPQKREIERIKSLGVDIYLGCWCSPQRCHGDVIKKILEETS